MMAAPSWVLLADEGRARILERQGDELQQLDELTDAGAHADNADFRRDAHGRRAGSGTLVAGNQTESAGEDKLDHEADLFARRVAARLAEAHGAGRYGALRIAAAPRFLGRLRKHLDDAVRQSVVEEIDKDLLQLDRRSLAERLFPDGR
jgi:protein required for attachment to host cells